MASAIGLRCPATVPVTIRLSSVRLMLASVHARLNCGAGPASRFHPELPGRYESSAGRNWLTPFGSTSPVGAQYRTCSPVQTARPVEEASGGRFGSSRHVLLAGSYAAP